MIEASSLVISSIVYCQLVILINDSSHLAAACIEFRTRLLFFSLSLSPRVGDEGTGEHVNSSPQSSSGARPLARDRGRKGGGRLTKGDAVRRDSARSSSLWMIKKPGKARGQPK